jgi:hypothetical protein
MRRLDQFILTSDESLVGLSPWEYLDKLIFILASDNTSSPATPVYLYLCSLASSLATQERWGLNLDATHWSWHVVPSLPFMWHGFTFSSKSSCRGPIQQDGPPQLGDDCDSPAFTLQTVRTARIQLDWSRISVDG